MLPDTLTTQSKARSMRPTMLPVVTLLAVAPFANAQVALQPKAGAPLDGLTPAQLELFWAGHEAYSTPVTIAGGLGPIMNKSNCVSCHTNPIGGWGSIAVHHYGIEDKGEFMLLPGETQSLLQSLAISPGCAEVVPPEATVFVQRITNSSLAFGLIEAIPDAAIAANADGTDSNGDGISGRVHWVHLLEDPTGPLRAGRFGWKAQVASTLSFSGDASRNEMGLTNDLVPVENAPNGNTAILTQCDAVADPEDAPDSEGFRFIDRVTHFQRYLAQPPQTPKSGMTGEAVFNAIGCNACHVRDWTTSDSPSLETAIRNMAIKPYSDFLLHNMGGLGDGVQQGDADESEMRTPVLWNLRTRDPMLHTGAAAGGTFATRVTKAIELHGPFGEGAASAAAFMALGGTQKAQLISFLGSLGKLEFDLEPDHLVDSLDFPLFQACFATGSASPDTNCGVADINQDGLINMVDAHAFMQAYEGAQGTADCDGDGQSDLMEILLGAPDLDGNLTPDDCVGCVADFNADGQRNGADLAILLAAWGTDQADTNGDGVTNGVDLGTLLAGWGSCG